MFITNLWRSLFAKASTTRLYAKVETLYRRVQQLPFLEPHEKRVLRVARAAKTPADPDFVYAFFTQLPLTIRGLAIRVVAGYPRIRLGQNTWCEDGNPCITAAIYLAISGMLGSPELWPAAVQKLTVRKVCAALGYPDQYITFFSEVMGNWDRLTPIQVYDLRQRLLSFGIGQGLVYDVDGVTTVVPPELLPGYAVEVAQHRRESSAYYVPPGATDEEGGAVRELVGV